MTAATRRKPRIRKNAVLGLADLDAVLDVPVSQWERAVARLVKELRAKGVRLDVPASRLGEESGGRLGDVTWVGLFDAQVRHLPRMDRPEEFRMARRYDFLKARVRDALIQAGHPAAQVDELVTRPVRALPKPARKPSAAARRHLERCVEELERLRNLYIEGALYLVHGPVRRYSGLGVDETDLIQEGNASLFQAIEGFDWRRDVRFKTYAVYWVQQAILKTLYNSSRTVRIPIWVQKAYRKIRRLQERGQHELGYEPDPLEIARLLDMPVDRVEDIVAVRRYAVSLDAAVASDDGAATLGQLLPDESMTPVHETVREGDLSVELRAVLEELPDREQTILRRRFGLDGSEPETLAEIAKDFGVTAERVRQLQKAAIERLQKPKPMDRLKAFA
jgi:RNA polymerase sigma factor (sigma-70 family)